MICIGSLLYYCNIHRVNIIVVICIVSLLSVVICLGFLLYGCNTHKNTIVLF